MRTLRHLFATVGLIALLFSGCSKQPVSQMPVSPDAPVLKVAVYADGRLTVEGKEATIETLRESFRSLKEKHGVVWYYREAGQQDPPPIAMEVVKAVIESRLPIRISSRPDYSDYVSTDGKSRTQ